MYAAGRPSRLRPRGVGYTGSIDNITIKTDRDANGSFETTELIETFTVDANLDADITPTSGGYHLAGNLTFDGVYKHTFDPWNRLVKIAKAYEDPGSGIQTGSTIMQAEYDGQGRRIVKQGENGVGRKRCRGENGVGYR